MMICDSLKAWQNFYKTIIRSENTVKVDMKQKVNITGMTCQGCVATVTKKLEHHPAIRHADVSLEDGIATLDVEHKVNLTDLEKALGEGDKYSIAKSEPVTIDTAPNDQQSWLETYKPLLLIFLFISGVTGLSVYEGGSLDVMKWMNYFMAGFFIVFSFFKFLDLDGFASSYAMYDLLAMRLKAYGYVYPYLELGLGIAYLTHFEPKWTFIATIVIMSFSSLGVILSVMDKRKIRCACLGAIFNLPMSTVTIIEDLLMVAMAAYMLIML